jgi:hypothetical protein
LVHFRGLVAFISDQKWYFGRFSVGFTPDKGSPAAAVTPGRFTPVSGYTRKE